MGEKWLKRRKRLFEILEVGSDLDRVSRMYDYFNAISIIVNLTVSIMYTYADFRERYGDWLLAVEAITVLMLYHKS